MKINSNQIYYAVESQCWGKNHNAFTTICYINLNLAKNDYKRYREAYMNVFSSEEKANVMYRLAKIQNGHSITLACCGFGVLDNFTFADNEPNI